MNNQIRKLAEESGLLPDSQWPGVQTRYLKKKEQALEKFAQLIVWDCINVIEKNMPVYDCKEDYQNLIRKAGRMDSIEEIKKYFGVN